MTPDQIKERLKSVKYPGFSRDIVSFGIVKDIELDSKRTQVRLLIVTENEDGRFATVVTQMQRPQGPPAPVEYRMHHRDGRWQIFDIRVDGVSLVAAYRRQFNSIVQTGSYTGLVQRLREYLVQTASTAPGSPAARAQRTRWRTALHVWTIETAVAGGAR